MRCGKRWPRNRARPICTTTWATPGKIRGDKICARKLRAGDRSAGHVCAAHQNLGYLLINFGQLDEGRAHLARAQAIAPSDVNRVMLATSLPVVYATSEEVIKSAVGRWKRLSSSLSPTA